MRKLFLLDPGHGGIIDGVYQTEGKRSPIWPDGSQLFEGEFTRDIVQRIMRLARIFDIDYLNLVHEQQDINLSERVQRANDIMKKNPNQECVYISIHANAGGGRGIEVFTSPGQTRSDELATIFFDKMCAVFPDVKRRTDMNDGDPDKEARFYVLTKTAMAAILTENFFMDTEAECKKYLLTDAGRHNIALAHIAAMVKIDQED